MALNNTNDQNFNNSVNNNNNNDATNNSNGTQSIQQQEMQLGSTWSEFCERHARAASSDFARSCIQFVNTNLPSQISSSLSHREFLAKFIECFSANFEQEYYRRSVQKVNN